MNRSFSIFLALMFAVAALVAVGIWWVGPKLVSLALIDPQRHQPYALLDLTRAADETSYLARYHDPFMELVSSEKGALLGDYVLEHQMHGRVAQAWQHLRGLHFAQATDLVQVLTASPYRLLNASVTDLQTLKLASFEQPAEQWRDVLVVWLLNEAQDTPRDPLRQILQAKPSSSRVVWQAQVESVDGQTNPWRRVVVIDFDDISAAYAWLRAPQVETQRTLLTSRVKELALLIFQRR